MPKNAFKNSGAKAPGDIFTVLDSEFEVREYYTRAGQISIVKWGKLGGLEIMKVRGEFEVSGEVKGTGWRGERGGADSGVVKRARGEEAGDSGGGGTAVERRRNIMMIRTVRQRLSRRLSGRKIDEPASSATGAERRGNRERVRGGGRPLSLQPTGAVV